MNGLIVDNFAGGGGASTGIEMALGRSVDIAVNHDARALEMHRANHPDTLHLCEDVFDVKPAMVCGGRPVDLAWFSPDCKHFSKAKGGRPVDKKVRGLAWVAVRWAREVRPAFIVLENVEEFQTWGPLGPDGRPDARRRGLTFRRFVGNLRGLGYTVDWRELVAADYGAPTTRKRLFLIARCDGCAIVWPEPTHGAVETADLFGHRHPWKTAAECIDWSLPCPSIFERTRPLVDATLRRIAQGIRRFVVEAPEPFICGIDNKSSGPGSVWPLGSPLTTITTENRHALVVPSIVKNYSGVTGHPVDRPLGAITTVDHHALCAAFLSKFYSTNVGSDLRAPVPTVTSTGQHLAEVRAFLVKYYGTGVGQRINDPLATITTKDRLGLVTVLGQQYQIQDIGLRMLQPHELFLAQGFPASYRLVGTKTDQVRLCGNSVAPPVAEAIVRENCRHAAARMVA